MHAVTSLLAKVETLKMKEQLSLLQTTRRPKYLSLNEHILVPHLAYN